MDKIKEAFSMVKNDINEIRGQLSKLVERIDNLAIEIKHKQKRKN